LTPRGEEIVEQCRTLLENRFADLVQRSGVSYSGYARDTRGLLAALSAPPERRSTGSPARDGRPPATPAQ
ncbi:MAG: hypothetical protein ICV72_15040, partial [Aldersonia sp.]|nr:hypothetical protein [Aldersonia sp.]